MLIILIVIIILVSDDEDKITIIINSINGAGSKSEGQNIILHILFVLHRTH